MKKTIEITIKEYEKLLEAEHFLDCLEACGVDNWGGYSDAWKMMNKEDEEGVDNEQ